jgi:DNA-binding transcriptional LysR family regulator
MKPGTEKLPFDLRALEVFLILCETKTMVAAARQLGLTQPAVSQVIADLETRIGVILFDRLMRPLALTPSGLMLRERATFLLSEARQIEPLLRQGDTRLLLVRIGLVESLQRAVLPALAADLAERMTQAIFLSGLTAAHSTALLMRQIDLSLGVDDLADIQGLERWPLIEEPYVLLCPAGQAPPESVEQMGELASRLRFIRYTARSGTGAEIERHLRRLRLELPPGQEFDTPFGVSEAVATGQGWAVSTPLCLHEAAIDPGRVACHRLPGPGLARRLTLIARARELGAVPGCIAGNVRRALKQGCLPRILDADPWLAGQITVP